MSLSGIPEQGSGLRRVPRLDWVGNRLCGTQAEAGLKPSETAPHGFRGQPAIRSVSYYDCVTNRTKTQNVR
jgi:hypothetical protein